MVHGGLGPGVAWQERDLRQTSISRNGGWEYTVFIFVFLEAGGVDPTFPFPAKELRMSFLEARSTLSIALESRAQDWSVEDLLQVERPLVSKELHFTLDGVVHGSESSDN